MQYLTEKEIKKIGINWDATIESIEQAVNCLIKNDYAQPIKPYLRYRDVKNRIIAMPAFLGGDFNIAGIKWIASFPGNKSKGIPRAHSVVILNNADTGEPVAIINTALISIIRTASVSGLMIKQFQKVRSLKNISLGIIGWGPIGQHHFKMCNEILNNCIDKIYIYDKVKIDENTIDKKSRSKTIIVSDWNEAYASSDIFITCTVSDERYIDKQPKAGSLHLNISLRDYKINVFDYFKNSIIVDNWEEVCRENTDIEMMNKEKGLLKEDTNSIIDVIESQCLRKFANETPVMFNPMGMGVFDIAIANYYYNNNFGS